MCLASQGEPAVIRVIARLLVSLVLVATALLHGPAASIRAATCLVDGTPYTITKTGAGTINGTPGTMSFSARRGGM